MSLEEKHEKYLEIAKRRSIKPLPNEVYEKSLQIPKEGIEVTTLKNIPYTTNPIFDFRVPDLLGKFAYEAGKIVFIDECGKTWVTPFCYEINSILVEAGYKKGRFYVPLSNGEKIVDPDISQRWESLCSEAKASNDERISRNNQERINKIATQKNIQSVPQQLFTVTIKIPETGLYITLEGKEKDLITPIPIYRLEELMGCYYVNENKIIFVDKTGSTYISPYAFEVALILDRCGFTKRYMNVPLANGEELVDQTLSLKWKEMEKDSLEAAKKRTPENGDKHIFKH